MHFRLGAPNVHYYYYYMCALKKKSRLKQRICVKPGEILASALDIGNKLCFRYQTELAMKSNCIQARDLFVCLFFFGHVIGNK